MEPEIEQTKEKFRKKSFPWKWVSLITIGLTIIFIVLTVYLFSSLREMNQKTSSLQRQVNDLIRKQQIYSGSQQTVSDGIYQKYQEIIDQLAELKEKEFEDEEIKQKIEELTQEIQKLRTLHPYVRFTEIKASFIPSGVPEIYGGELNISFDAVQDAINKVAILDPTYGQEGKKITLTGTDLERYIKIGSRTSCEYCCGAKTLVNKNGQAACGCDHSQMMRGLAAYLIKNHPKFSDEQILKELNTWKITYFPKQTLTAKFQEMEKAGEPGIKELLEEFPEFLPQMVGGC